MLIKKFLQRKRLKLLLRLEKKRHERHPCSICQNTINLPGGPAEVLDEATEAVVTGLEAAESV